MTKPVLYLAALLCAIPVTFMPRNVMAEDTLQAADVFVTASGYGQDVKDTPASVTVITKEELEKMIAPSSYTGICSVLARELADKAEAKAKMMTEK